MLNCEKNCIPEPNLTERVVLGMQLQLLGLMNPSLAATHRWVVIAEIEHGLVNDTVGLGLMCSKQT